MAEKLIVRMGDTCEWLITGVADGASALVKQGSPDEMVAAISELNWHGEVVALVPGERVLLTSAMVPSRQQRQIVQAVPNLIEEQLASDIDECHFALGNRNAAGAVCVAVVSLADMHHWTGLLAEAGVNPTLMYPDTLMAEWSEGVCITVDGKRVHFRTDKCAGFTVASSLMAFAAELLPEIDNILLCVSPDDIAELALQIAQIEAIDSAQLSVRQSATTGLALLAHHVDDGSLNLLQGEFEAVREPASGFWVWKSAAILAVCTFLLHLSLILGQGIFLEISANRDALEAMSLYREIFPDTRNVRDVRRRWNAHLSGSGSVGSDDFLELFNGAAKNLSGSVLTLNNVNYNKGRGDLILQFMAPRSEQLVQYSQSLLQAGLIAEIGTISQEGDAVRGSIKIKSSGGA